MATCFMPSESRRGNSSSRPIPPSSRLYCVCRWRCANSVILLVPVYSPWPVRSTTRSCASLAFLSLPMGPFTRLPVRGRWALLVALAGACSNRVLPPLPDVAALVPVSIEASSDTLAVPPFASRQLVFHVRGPQGEAVPGVVMHFSILDDADTPGSGGAQLSFADAITDGDGAVTLQVIAGQGASGQNPLTFTVQASAGDALLDIPIFVTTGALASVEIMPVFPDQSSIDNPVIATNIYFYDGT